jgi:hypothetical protein
MDEQRSKFERDVSSILLLLRVFGVIGAAGAGAGIWMALSGTVNSNLASPAGLATFIGLSALFLFIRSSR